MGHTFAGNAEQGFHVSIAATAEWQQAPHNMLLEGPDASTATALLLLEPQLRQPIVWKRQGDPLEIPVTEVGALILQDVGSLEADEQTRLLRWLEDAPRTKIISTTANPLFSRVERGLFDPSLYYRLNVMLLQLD